MFFLEIQIRRSMIFIFIIICYRVLERAFLMKVGISIWLFSLLLLSIQGYMKTEIDDCNYELMISKLAKGSIDDKALCLRKLLGLYQNSRARIYLYERRITECLQLSLLIEQKDICLNALSLLEKIIISASSQSEIVSIIKKRLLSKMVLNLGSIEVTIRKISHKCILEFLRKFRDLDTLIAVYIKTAISQNQNCHLKLKAINSLHSLLMAESKHYHHQLSSAQTLLQELIHAAYQKDYGQIRRAGLIGLIFILKIKGVDPNLKALSSQAQNQLYQLKYQNQQLSLLLESILRMGQFQSYNQVDDELQNHNAPSPKFISIQNSIEVKTQKPEAIDVMIEKIPQNQLKIFNEVSLAEDFLKKLEKTSNWELNEISQFAPFLQKCLIDDSIKLFSISKKIVEVIFNSEDGKKKQYYVVLVPCIVSGIGNKRFIVRKNLDKMVRSYVKNHTEVWFENLIERFATNKNIKVKEMLLDLAIHAYRTSPQFYYPPQRPFEVFNHQIIDTTSSLKRKVLDCILLIVQRQGKDDKVRDEMLHLFASEPYNKIVRKLGKTNYSVGQQSEQGQKITLEPISPVSIRKQRKQRLITAEPEKLNLIDKSIQRQKTENVSQEKYRQRPIIQYSRQRKVRNSHIQINFKISKKQERKSKDDKQKTSIERLPQLKKAKNSSTSKYENGESPVKRSMGERNIIYVEKQNLRPLENPKNELERALVDMKDSNWSIQFDGISKIRSVVQFHRDLLNEQNIPIIVNELLQNLSNLRSGITKLALMCLNEMMRKLHKKMYQFSENIILTIIKKSITTSEFMQDEIKKCIATAVEELCLSKIISALNSVRQSRSVDIRMTLMLCVESMIRTERIYRKESEWIWNVLIHFNEQPQFNLRSECKRLAKLILEMYKDWKNDCAEFRKEMLEKIDKLLKTLSTKGQNNLWIEIQNYEFQKSVLNKAITQKYFANQYPKFQELDRSYTIKKNWKERMRLINELFQTAYDHPNEFENSTSVKKYIQIAIDQIDDKNPGLLINTINNLIKSLDHFPNVLEEFIGGILEKLLPVLETRRGEITGIATKLLHKLYSRFDPNKIAKEYLRLLVSNSKSKNQIVNQLLILLRDPDRQLEHRSIRELPLQKNSSSHDCGVSPQAQSIFIKSLTKICSQKSGQISGNWGYRLKELIGACQRRFGQQFTNKLMMNSKIVEMMS